MISEYVTTDGLRSLARRAVGRLRDAWYRITLAAITAAVAWVIAQHLLGMRAPIFAPIAAVVCLTDAPGARGRRAVRLLGGVLVGVAVGEAAARVIGSGWLQVAVALAVGMLVVSLASINPLTMLQAGIAALLVVGTGSPAQGWSRLASAVIGGVLALLVSQVLAAPSPVRLLAGAAATALGPPREALSEAAAALRERSAERAGRATENLRAGHETLSAFLGTRGSVDKLAGGTVRGRRERDRVHALQRRFGGLEYVYAGSVLLARTATELVDSDADVPEELIVGIEDLAAILCAVADDPRNPDPDVPAALPTGVPTGGTASGAGPPDAHGLAEHLAGTEPSAHGRAGQLATELRLLAEDVATLTEGTPTAAAVR